MYVPVPGIDDIRPDIQLFSVSGIRQVKYSIRPHTGYQERPDYPADIRSIPNCNPCIFLYNYSEPLLVSMVEFLNIPDLQH
jgi:hypothetical protein